MADKKKQVVVAPLVSVKGPGGALVYLYRGASLENVDASEVKRLDELGMLGEPDEDVVPGVAPEPA